MDRVCVRNEVNSGPSNASIERIGRVRWQPKVDTHGISRHMSEAKRKRQAATRAHLVIAIAVVLLFFFPFIAKFRFGNDVWFHALFGNNRIFLFWVVGYGVLFGALLWADRHPDKLPSWWHKPIA